MKEQAKKTAAPAPEPKCMCGGAGPALTELLDRLGPDETVRRHFDAARVEFLKGIRAIVDRRIADLSSKGSKGTHVNVE